MARKYIAETDITAWLKELSGDNLIIAPVVETGTVVYRPYTSGSEVELVNRPVSSPKEAVFPQTELLFTYKQDKTPEDPGRTKVDMKEATPDRATVFFGPRPCGTRGITMFDKVYNCGKQQDTYYVTRRENTAFVTIACTRPDATCFCHSVNSGPADPDGSDVLLVPVQGGYVAEAITDKGTELLAYDLFSDAGKREQEANAVIDKAREMLGDPHDFTDAESSLYKLFDDMEFWDEQAAKCINCGACTYLCPTCHCFNITDQTAGLSGRRIRTWDNCMSYEFTLEGSGHNPRPTKAHRLKNRLGHKFAYYPENNEGLVACCGCGRCIERCPSGVDIRAIVLAAKERSDVQK